MGYFSEKVNQGDFIQNQEFAQAHILSVDKEDFCWIRSHRNYPDYMYVEFQTKDGKEVSTKVNIHCEFDQFKDRSTVEIIYDKNEPSKIAIRNFEVHDVRFVILQVIAVLFLILPFTFAYFRFRKKKI
jgi:hypothetical protein